MESKYPFDHKIIYIHGLYGSGKSRRLYLIAKHDHFHDLCLSLNNIFHSRKSKNYLTCYVIKNRNNKHKLKALPIPLHNPHLTKKRLIKYKHSHKHSRPVKNIIIDEVVWVKLGTLRSLLILLRQVFPHVKSIILAGIMSNNARCIPFPTCKYLANHCKTIEIKKRCQFCHRKATNVLAVYDGKDITNVQWLFYFKIYHHMTTRQLMYSADKYYVCQKHLLHPPMEQVLKTKPAFVI